MNRKEGEEIENYKGIYFNNDEKEEQRYFEGGAHFQYKDLCKRLERQYNNLPPHRRGTLMYNNDKLAKDDLDYTRKGNNS